MGYVILASIALIVILLGLHQFNKSRLKSQLVQIRSTWGCPKSGPFNFELIEKLNGASSFHQLSQQTKEDIDFHSLFAFVDRTTSRIGQQFLFRKLSQPSEKTTDSADGQIQLFASNQSLREEIQLQLHRLSSSDAYYVSSLLDGMKSKKPKWYNLHVVNVALVIGLLLFSFQFPFLLLFALIPITLNFFFHYRNKSNTFQFIRSFPQLSLLIDVSGILLQKHDLVYDKIVEGHVTNLRSIQRSALLINLDQGGTLQSELSQLGSFLSEIVKAVFLIEVFALYRVVRDLASRQASIATIFDYVGGIDTAISIGSLRAGKAQTCIPKFTSEQKELSAKGVYHPLIKHCVPNDLLICGKSVLITGSNMSGKSTFLRTIIINSILAQTIHTCFAVEFTTPILKQFSSIRIDDSISDGQSYYFKEVNVVGALLKESELPEASLFVLDEVFKGTNTNERIAAGKAVLSYLNKENNIVVVSTHDMELAKMLSGEFDIYHFTETIENDQLQFDHRMKPGELRTSNAIKILKLCHFPVEIVTEATEISASITARKKEEDVRAN